MKIKNVHGNTVDRLGEQIVGGVYEPGDSMPPFYLPNESGHMVALDHLLATVPWQ